MKRCSTCQAACEITDISCQACGADELTLEPTLVDGRYLVEAPLGKGTLGVVFKARDRDLDRDVALKLIATRAAEDPAAVNRLRREAAALAAIRNEHVVQVYSFGAHRSSYFFAMEYVRGLTLEELISAHVDHGAFVPVHRALTILLQIAEGLEAAHAVGLVHRDVKPDNVIIEEHSGRPVLVDFGIAHRAGADESAAGTPSYMAPEQTGLTKSTAIGPATDVYGFACTAFDLLANRPPFLGVMVNVLTHQAHVDPPRLSSLRPELAPLDLIFARALAKQAELRFPSAGALRVALEAVAARWLSEPPGATSRETSDEPLVATDPAAARVLIVDDDAAFLRFASCAAELAARGEAVEVRTAASGAVALQSARIHAPDVVILDFDMPRLDGLATLSALRALPGGTRSQVLVVSARAGDDERWKFGVLGVGSFVEKPVALPVLVEAIAEAIPGGL